MLVPVINPITDSAADRECECQRDCQWRLVSSGGYHCWLPLRGLLRSLSHWKYDDAQFENFLREIEREGGRTSLLSFAIDKLFSFFFSTISGLYTFTSEITFT